VRRLILEGSQHAVQEAESQDALHTAYLTEHGYQMKRFWNEQVNAERKMCWRRLIARWRIPNRAPEAGAL